MKASFYVDKKSLNPYYTGIDLHATLKFWLTNAEGVLILIILE